MSESAYRLFLSLEEWHALPAKLEDPFFKAIAETNERAIRLIRQGEGTSPVDVPSQLEASRPRPDPATIEPRAIKVRLLREAVAWRLNPDGDHLDEIRRLLAFACNGLAWGQSGNLVHAHWANLHTGDMLYIGAFGLDAIGPDLGDELHTRLRERVIEGLRNYLAGLEHGEWWRHADFNWGCALHGQAGLAALAIEPFDSDLTQRVLDEARVGLTYVIENFQPHGGWTEGFMYETTTVAHLTDFVAALYRVTGDDLGLLGNRDFHDVLQSRTVMVAPDGQPLNFSNINAPTCEYPMAHVYWWARQLDRPQWTGFEDAHVKDWRDLHGIFHDVEAFWFREAHQPSETPAIRPITHLRGLDWCFWRGQTTWLGFRSGFNGGNHNNRDLGHFIFGAGEDRFLVDPGYGAGATNQHNAITVRGQQQTDAATAKIFRLRELDGGFYLCCDLSECFPHSMALYYRHLLLIDDRHLLVVDDVLGKRGRRASIEFHLQSHRPPTIDSSTCRIDGRQHSLTVRHLTPIAALGSREWEHAGQPVHTISWRNDWDRIHSVSATLLSVDARAESTAAWEREMDRGTLVIDGRRWAINLAEGSLIVTESEEGLR